MTTAWSVDGIGDLRGKVMAVTGANAGLGLEIARVLAGRGARVLMACRNRSKAEAARNGIIGEFPDADLVIVDLDLADLSSVSKAAATINQQDRLDALINNAGLMALDASKTADGFETQFGVNHLGHFALTAEVLPRLLGTPGSRVATMSSMGHRMGRMQWDNLNAEKRYERWPAYFQSKLANLLFTAELHRRLAQAGVATIAVAAHPGATGTDLGSEGSGFTNKAMSAFERLAQPVTKGALPMLRSVTDPAVVGGQYYGCRFMMMGAPVLETPSACARNAEDARRLWEISEQLTGRTMPVG